MRNLKRALSLALAAAMLISLMVVGASATSYNDQDAVSQAEAVQLLTDLGIVGGDQNGNFNPTATLTRAEFTVMMSNLLNGSKFDTTLFDGTDTPFTDVQGHWAAPYIAYCYSAGVIAGTSETTFSPDATLTSAQAAAILLMALGYNQNSEFAVNGQFALNVTAIAQREGLYEDLSVAANSGVSRENVAQMIKNALFMTPQEYLSVLQIYQDVEVNGAPATLALTQFKDLTVATGVLTAVDEDGYATVFGTPNIAPSAKVIADVNDMGKAITYYYYDGDNDKIVSTVAVPASDNTVTTVPGNLQTTDDSKATYVNRWLTNNGLELPAANAGAIVTDYVYASCADTNPDITAAELANIGNYTVAYVVDSDQNGTIDVLVKTTKDFGTVSGDIRTRTDADGNVTVYVPGITSGYVKAVGYEDLAKDDMAMYITAAGITYITKCETVQGLVTATRGTDTVYLDGTAYTISTPNTQTAATINTLGNDSKDTVMFYLDENGNVLNAKAVDASNAYNVAIVLGYDVSSSTVDDTTVASARLLKADGTIEVVDVASVTRGKVANGTASSTALAGDGVNGVFSGSGTLDKNDNDLALNVSMVPVAYTIDDDGKYELTTLGADTVVDGDAMVAAMLTNATVNNNVAAFATGYVGNANTVFTVAKYNDNTGKLSSVDVSTGIANAPKYTDTADGLVITVKGTAALVFIYAGTQQDVTTDSVYVYIPTGSSADPIYNSADKTYTYESAYVNGEQTTLVSKISLTRGQVMKVAYNDDGQVSSEANVNTLGTAYDNGTGVEYADGVLTIDTKTGGTKDYYTLADDAKVFEIEDNELREIAASAIAKDATDAVIVLGDNDMNTTKVAQYVYITKTDEDGNGFSVQAYTVGSTGAQTNQGSAQAVSTGTDETTASVVTAETVTIAAATDAQVGLKVTAQDDGSIVTVSAPQDLVSGTTSYEFTVTATAEDGTRQVCTVTVTFTSVTEA